MSIITSPKPFSKVRLGYIDALRGLAAMMVLVCHSLQVDMSLNLPKGLAQSLQAGKYGVQLFFVISALTIFYSLKNSDTNFTNFFIRRFFRIAPLYFVAVIVYSWMFKANPKGILLNLTFLHGFSPRYINSIVPGGWSIGVEMVFYCMVPLLFRRVSNLSRSVYLFAGALIFSFASVYVYRKFCASTSDFESFIYFWLPNQLPIFGLGFIAYYLSFDKKVPEVRKVFYPLLLLCLIVIFSILTKLSIIGEHVVFAMAIATLIFLLSKRTLPGLVNKVTLFLGKVSYSLYLSQYAALAILTKTGFFSLFQGSSKSTVILNVLLNLTLLFITTVLLSIALYYIIEQPFQKIGKKIIHRRSQTKVLVCEQVIVEQVATTFLLPDTLKS